MNNQYNLIPKIYDIDYSFLIKNYLNPSLWDNSWNLFCYKDFNVTLKIYNIDCNRHEIDFRIEYPHNIYDNWDNYQIVSYNLNNTSIDIFKQQICGALFRLLENYEKHAILNSYIYQELNNKYANEDDVLREIAENYLNDCGVGNDDIREAYIEKYIENNSVKEDKLSLLLSNQTYIYLPDYFLVLTKCTKDNTRYEMIKTKVDSHTDLNIDELMKEAKLIDEEDYDYFEELRDRLESI